MTSSKSVSGKRTYEKPSVQQVRLVPGEAVLATCKDGGAGACAPDPSCLSQPGS